MNILITGGTGFIGQPLCARLLKDGHELTLVLRDAKSLPADWALPCAHLIWDPTKTDCPQSLDDFDAIIHLMGESIAKSRWTKLRKSQIRNSRGLATQRLAAAVAKRQKPLACFIAASATGYFPYDRSEDLAEHAAPGNHFLAEVCQEWETAAHTVPAERQVILRFGLVLGPNGGAMEKLLPLFAAGLGGRLGKGDQMLSWVHRDDILRMITLAVRDDSWSGIYNAVSPDAVSNEVFTETLGRSMNRPVALSIPAFAMRMALGEMSSMLLRGQKVVPLRLIQQGFTFRFPRIAEALQDVSAVQRLESFQFVDRPVNEVFAFFCDPRNLERLTPASLHFKIDAISTPDIKAGTTIDYSLRLRGVPFHWKTLIKEWQPGASFVDIQEKGPYELWHHTHRFHPVKGGTLMVDEVKYKVPLGWLGERFALPFVRGEVQEIFAFRKRSISEIFNKNK